MSRLAFVRPITPSVIFRAGVLFTAMASITACSAGGEFDDDHNPEEAVLAKASPELNQGATFSAGKTDVLLRLLSRSGESKLGWSIDQEQMVEAPDAHFTISSSDCGARGRWVMLEAKGITFCSKEGAEECGWSSSIEVGGSNPSIEVGDTFVAMRDGVVIADVTLVNRTATEFDWLDESPLPPFEVELEIERREAHPIVRCRE